MPTPMTVARRAYAKAYYLANREKLLAQGRAWASAHPDRVRTVDKGINLRRTLKRYGATVEWYDEMLSAQEWCCAICDDEFTDTPHIDHNHTTGMARGLLCNRCNRSLGFMRDDFEIVQHAAEYLAVYS